MTPVIRVCQKCGTDIPADAPEGGCPGCLLETALDATGGQVVFGRYKLVKVLGRGGMGIVWLARDEELERDVALKFLPDLMIQDRALLDQLKHETKRCLELTHPHIVRIHDFVHDDRSGCISMEYVDGETLSNLRAEKEQKVFEPDEIADWITQLCEALDYAHNHAKVIHRDLKPANLMMNKRGDLKITDFGIARSLADSASRLTGEQGRSGTLVYMSPQQLGGNRGTNFDDIYSLGASIYELLTSKPPFYSGNIDRQICERIAPPVTERRKEFNIEPASVPQTWEKTVAACLAKDPSKRPQSAVEVAHQLQLPTGSSRIAIVHAQPAKKKLLLIAGIAAACALVLAGIYFRPSNGHAKAASQIPAIPEKSIAVLPFENRSEEKANAYFAEGIQDEILTRLSKIADLKVISRTSTRHYKSAPENLREIARELGVAHIVEGSVQKSGDAVRVNVQLINAATDSHVWADTFDRKLTDIFSVESEVSQKIAAALQANLSPSESHVLAAVQTPDTEAYDLFLRGEYEFRQAESSPAGEGYDRADAFYRQALARDPNFAEAAAALARSRLLQRWFVAPFAPAELEEVKSLIDHALALAPNSPEAHLARGLLFYYAHRQYEMALAELNRTLELQPNNALAQQYCGWVYRRRGEWERSLASSQRAQELDPRDAMIPATMGSTYVALRQWKEAERAQLRALAVDPHNAWAPLSLLMIRLSATGDVGAARRTFDDFPEAIKSLTHATSENTGLEGWIGMRAYIDVLERRFTDAFQAFEKEVVNDDRGHLRHLAGRVALGMLAGQTETAKSAGKEALPLLEATLKERPDDTFAMTWLSWVYLALGRNADALRLSKQAADTITIEKDATSGPILQIGLAQVEARAGAPEEAIKRLRRLLSIPAGHVVSIARLKIDPVWDPLRNRPDFQQLLSGPEQIGPNK
jgi:serine/threonine protein kinase/Tfp pilus assembly protein PilF